MKIAMKTLKNFLENVNNKEEQKKRVTEKEINTILELISKKQF